MRDWFGVMALRVLMGLQILSARPHLPDRGPGVVPDRGEFPMGAASGAHLHMVGRLGMLARFGVLRGGSDAEAGPVTKVKKKKKTEAGQGPPASDGGAGEGLSEIKKRKKDKPTTEAGQGAPKKNEGAGKGKAMTKKERKLLQLSNELPPRVLRTLDGLATGGWEMVNETAVHPAPCPCWTSLSQFATPEAAQGQIDGFFSQLPYKCHQNRVASVGD